jgi:hypothetical protein
MDEKLNAEESGLNITPNEQNEDSVIFNPKVEEEGRIDEFPESEKSYEELQAEVEALDREENPNNVDFLEPQPLMDEDDLDKKNYLKITPTFYIKPHIPEEDEEVPEGVELFKVLNPETGVAEKRPLTDDEKREVYIRELKDSRIRFRNSVHDGNVTHTKFGVQYKQKRKRRNTLAKKSRKTNRK